MKTGPVDGALQNWTPQEVTAGTVTAKRDDVLKIERYRRGGGHGDRVNGQMLVTKVRHFPPHRIRSAQ